MFCAFYFQTVLVHFEERNSRLSGNKKTDFVTHFPQMGTTVELSESQESLHYYQGERQQNEHSHIQGPGGKQGVKSCDCVR